MKKSLFWFLSFFLFMGTEALAETGALNKPIDDEQHIDPKVLDLGTKAYMCARKQGYDEKEILTIIDYSMPSSKPRMWVLDMKTKTVKFEEYVAHGKNSGGDNATSFSNQNGSKQSSYGVFLTNPSSYQGSKGTALRVQGLEPGVNDHAMSRAVVFHGANYVSEDFVKRMGRLGRSWGCPALEPGLTKPTIDTIKGGTVVFAYYPDQKWLDESKFLHC